MLSIHPSHIVGASRQNKVDHRRRMLHYTSVQGEEGTWLGGTARSWGVSSRARILRSAGPRFVGFGSVRFGAVRCGASRVESGRVGSPARRRRALMGSESDRSCTSCSPRPRFSNLHSHSTPLARLQTEAGRREGGGPGAMGVYARSNYLAADSADQGIRSKIVQRLARLARGACNRTTVLLKVNQPHRRVANRNDTRPGPGPGTQTADACKRLEHLVRARSSELTRVVYCVGRSTWSITALYVSLVKLLCASALNPLRTQYGALGDYRGIRQPTRGVGGLEIVICVVVADVSFPGGSPGGVGLFTGCQRSPQRQLVPVQKSRRERALPTLNHSKPFSSHDRRSRGYTRPPGIGPSMIGPSPETRDLTCRAEAGGGVRASRSVRRPQYSM